MRLFPPPISQAMVDGERAGQRCQLERARGACPLCYVGNEFGKKKKGGGGCLVCVSKAFAAIPSSLGGFCGLGMPPCIGSLLNLVLTTLRLTVVSFSFLHGWSKSEKSLHKYCIFCANIRVWYQLWVSIRHHLSLMNRAALLTHGARRHGRFTPCCCSARTFENL